MKLFLISLIIVFISIQLPNNNSYSCTKKLLEEIEYYFNNQLKSAKADFVQEDRFGNQSEGVLYMKRPGKLKFDYNFPKHAILLVFNNKIIFYDSELEEANYIKSSAVSLLSRDNLRFYHDASVKSCNMNKEDIDIVLSGHELDVLLAFKLNPLTLTKISTIDNDNTIIANMFLNNIVYNPKISPTIFDFTDPQLSKLNTEED